MTSQQVPGTRDSRSLGGVVVAWGWWGPGVGVGEAGGLPTLGLAGVDREKLSNMGKR